VVQADTHKTTATTTTRMTCFHHVGTVFQGFHMLVSSGLPDGLAGCRLPSACELEALARVISQGSPGDHAGHDQRQSVGAGLRVPFSADVLNRWVPP
jgi:hypothetical protein